MAQYNTRIQLKSDTETNWRKIHNTFIPLMGEMIIYTPDNEYSYNRVKIGNGSSTLANLDFIDAGTVNGKEVEVVKMIDYDHRPLVGSPDKLYVDLSTNLIYHYDSYSGYTQLANFSLNISNTTASRITEWDTGIIPEISVENNILILKNGRSPSLSYYDVQAVNKVQKVI